MLELMMCKTILSSRVVASKKVKILSELAETR
jgi:hypothetical protein